MADEVQHLGHGLKAGALVDPSLRLPGGHEKDVAGPSRDRLGREPTSYGFGDSAPPEGRPHTDGRQLRRLVVRSGAQSGTGRLLSLGIACEHHDPASIDGSAQAVDHALRHRPTLLIGLPLHGGSVAEIVVASRNEKFDPGGCLAGPAARGGATDHQRCARLDFEPRSEKRRLNGRCDCGDVFESRLAVAPPVLVHQ